MGKSTQIFNLLLDYLVRCANACSPNDRPAELHVIARATGKTAKSFYRGLGFLPTRSFGEDFTTHAAEEDMIFTFRPENLASPSA